LLLSPLDRNIHQRKYRITSKQYVEGGLQLRVISETPPELECMSVPATLEDAYIYFTNKEGILRKF